MKCKNLWVGAIIQSQDHQKFRIISRKKDHDGWWVEPLYRYDDHVYGIGDHVFDDPTNGYSVDFTFTEPKQILLDLDRILKS